ncbi:tRNA pseudouridine synthase [Coemansia reversa NRRL 1564]|uniref:tRNA pseudouridine synthase n=1 Tax=Coemansia reversa (strain ATCC 12441 / NRRL 1564) TaxID=763665 RepID=A0A2G5B443_COERN|nr:tRNA pseudouridine synthase [Coemansia reversa NRRL 1564]|eukprot:PIA13772.1 tRNA pseudouridine synthase [Coemansia reversa NRRL 1564]
MDYEGWTKEALVARLRDLDKLVGNQKRPDLLGEARSEPVLETMATMSDTTGAATEGEAEATPRKRKMRKTYFDFGKLPKRKIALKFSYLGWPYYGLARQGNVLESAEKQKLDEKFPTVEGVLFRAMASCGLIMSESTCGYSRCGRTDRGVSSFGQVVSLYVRSSGSFITEEEVVAIEEEGGEKSKMVTRDIFNDNKPVLLPPIESELPYASMLNKHLPPEIRILAWSPVSVDFNARFSCTSRFYKYYFSEQGLNIEVMQMAARRFLGTHDFRNFCRLDPAKQITNFERSIKEIAIVPVSSQVPYVGDASSPEGRWWQLELRGTAFLWHQVRCMVAMLFAVGQGLEDADIIDKMLDVTTMNGKPEYEMACDTPLVLANCAFNESDVQWIYTRSAGRELQSMSTLDRTILRTWRQLSTRSVLCSGLLHNLRVTEVPALVEPDEDESLEPKTDLWFNCLAHIEEAEQRVQKSSILGGGIVRNVKRYVPIVKRRRAAPVEQRNQEWLERKGVDKRVKCDQTDQGQISGLSAL